MTTKRQRGKKQTAAADARLSLAPLTVEEALRGAMATGKPPEMPKRERSAKRTTRKRKLGDPTKPAR